MAPDRYKWSVAFVIWHLHSLFQSAHFLFSFVEEMDQTVPVSSDVTLLDENHDDKDSETFYTETGTINNYVFSNMV
jgi:hypothetical protein